jgi:hypothetical protein
MTGRASLTPGRKRPGPTKSHARQARAATASPPNRKPTRRKSGDHNRPRAKKPQIPEYSGENGPRGTQPENSEGGDHNASRALALLNAHPRKFAHGGAVIATWRYYHGQKRGPYYRLRFRAQGRIRGIYLGRESPQVQAVRARLAELHQVLAQRRTCEKLIQNARAQDHVDLAALRRQLEAAGLRPEALQARGWGVPTSPAGERRLRAASPEDVRPARAGPTAR